MRKKINKLPLIQFELTEHVNLDGFDARRVVGDLIKHKELWESVVMMPDPSWGLLHLRDLAENTWNVDCLVSLRFSRRGESADRTRTILAANGTHVARGGSTEGSDACAGAATATRAPLVLVGCRGHQEEPLTTLEAV